MSKESKPIVITLNTFQSLRLLLFAPLSLLIPMFLWLLVEAKILLKTPPDSVFTRFFYILTNNDFLFAGILIGVFGFFIFYMVVETDMLLKLTENYKNTKLQIKNWKIERWANCHERK